MPRKPKTLQRHDEERPSPVWTAVVLMASSVVVLATVSLFLVRNHEWTDALVSALPGPASCLAADPGLAGQMRIRDVSAQVLSLGDQTRTLVAEASVVNDAMIPAEDLKLEVTVFAGGEEVRRAASSCGKTVSERLLRRLTIAELLALSELDPGYPVVLQPGATISCQVTVPEIPEDIDEASFRIASVEARPGHPPARFHLHHAE